METSTAELDCKVESLPSIYLGLPLGACYKSMKSWDGIKVGLWKRRYIFKGGHATLIKNMLIESSYLFLVSFSAS